MSDYIHTHPYAALHIITVLADDRSGRGKLTLEEFGRAVRRDGLAVRHFFQDAPAIADEPATSAPLPLSLLYRYLLCLSCFFLGYSRVILSPVKHAHYT